MNEKLEALMKEERRRYQREWRSKNKDKVKAINQRYWANRVRRKLEGQASQREEATAK